ncbi:MAG: D-alanyl-D-alanine carboxypeptidase [Oscillospiraceae bacterium]|jgi:D-alanyl-D-alanine carboxypeptidase (penicillin-binding protein 5/6)|nr:D-alanyl-D-alanine carboxypeptidase [Oscillospiraceae bacterium]
MRRKTVPCLLLSVFLLLPSITSAFAAEPPVSAAGAILIDAATGTVLFEKNADGRRLIASTTKIVTGLVVLEGCADLDEMIEVPIEATRVEGSSMYLKAGQAVTVRDLLYGLLLKSGNDAAVALAIHCAGSVEAFAAKMNEKAAALGLKNTSFSNPHGLNAEHHYSTARDMAVLTRAALANEAFSRIVSSKYAQINGITIKNHNRMLWYYSGADGVKTGYTIHAGRCLVSSATRDGMRLVAVTLNDHNDWADHTAMLDYGFERYTLQTLCTEEEIFATIPALGGGDVTVKAAQTERVLLPKEKAGLLKVDVILPRYLWAPVIPGQRVGMLTASLDGAILARCPLLAY